MRCFFIPVFFCFISMFGNGQNELPVIATTINEIDIKDGDELSIGEWYLDFTLKPDVYTSNKIGETVTFYTDLDSISFEIQTDKVYDFVIIHGTDSAFTQVKYAPTNLDKLKKAAAYDRTDNTTLPPFTYQDASNKHLQQLRTGFNLDSIAGNGSDSSKIINLMHWVHELIPHDGNHENPAVKNAMSLIKTCKRKERGLNCRGLATVLNECYLSLGIKSRMVTCMPKDSIFQGCHVINMVYAEDLNKWVWMDPTWDTYVTDGSGNLLSIEEVRLRLINDESLEINPKANWNHQSTTDKEYYLYDYMAELLYRLDCPASSEYNLETGKRGKKVEYIELLPLDGYNQTPKLTKKKFRKSGVTHLYYKTNNPDAFWAKP